MKNAPLLEFVSLVLAGCIALALSNSASAKPKAVNGEPAIERGEKDELGRRVYLQNFEAPERLAEIPDSSISRLYSVLGGDGEYYPETKVRMRCKIPPSGRVQSSNCATTTYVPAPLRRVLRAVGSPQGKPVQLDYRALDRWHGGSSAFASTWVHSRYVTYDLRLPSMTAPNVDITTGRMVEPEEVLTNRNEAFGEYPSKALREGWEANLDLVCQIQNDLSVICEKEAFEAFGVRPTDDPKTAWRAFRRHFELGRIRLRAQGTLVDGTDARGVRFNMRLTYRIS